MIYVGPKNAPKSYQLFFKREIVEMNSFWAHGMMLEEYINQGGFRACRFSSDEKIGPFARLKAEKTKFMANPLGARNKGLIAGLIKGNPS